MLIAISNFRLDLEDKNDKERFKPNHKTSKILIIQKYQKDKNCDKALGLCNELEKGGRA